MVGLEEVLELRKNIVLRLLLRRTVVDCVPCLKNDFMMGVWAAPSMCVHVIFNVTLVSGLKKDIRQIFFNVESSRM